MNQNKRSDINKSLLNGVQFSGKGFVIQTGKMRIAESGRSMVEMLGVLVIIGILSVVGVASYIYAMNKHRANEIIQGVKERAVIGSGQRMNEHPVDFHEFSELIMDYTTGSQNTGLNGEKDFFTVMVNDVPQAVCQNVLNMNWDWPAGVFVNNVSEEACPVGNHQMAFVFAADLSDKIAREQDPCYGQGPCCITIPGTRQIRVGELLLDRTCKGSGENVCCSAATLGCRYGEDIEKYRPYQTTRATCGEDGVHKCLNDLSCVCKSCQNAQMVQDSTTCACSCPNGYQASTCESGHSYQSGELKDVFGNTLCYQCTACAELSAQDSRCRYTTGTDTNGCPTQTVASCSCSAGYSATACVRGTNYQVDTETLPDNTRCYKCENCPGLSAQDSRCRYTTGTDANGCPTQTVASCSCSAGYSTTACAYGSSYTVSTITLPDATQCYSCAACKGNDPQPVNKCFTTRSEPGQNGCPARTVYEDLYDLPATVSIPDFEIRDWGQTVDLASGGPYTRDVKVQITSKYLDDYCELYIGGVYQYCGSSWGMKSGIYTIPAGTSWNLKVRGIRKGSVESRGTKVNFYCP